MIVENKYTVKLSEIDRNNQVTNKALLSYFEDIGGIHSNKAGYGIYDIPQTHLTWLLLEWKLQVIRRPLYNETVKIKTWSKNSIRCYAYRDFEVYDEKANVIVKAISKWLLIDTEKEKIVKVEDSVLSKYEPELEKTVFENEEFEKIKEPEKFELETEYKVRRLDIDINNHMHNLNYIDLAIEAVPKEIYETKQFDNIRISYKREIKLGETVKCKYSFENEKHIISVKSEDDKILHAIIELN